MLKVITVTTHVGETIPLLNSLEKHGWATECLVVPEWKGFGTKLLTTYDFLKLNPEVTEFIFCDAFDVVALGGPDEFNRLLQFNYSGADMVCSGERGLWPPTMEKYRPIYTKHEHGFNYINSGCYYAKSEAFIRLMDFSMPKHESDDQEWMNMAYLNAYIVLKQTIDNAQILFNSHSFIEEGDYGYENNRIQINGKEPIFIHSNARTVDPKLDEMLKNL